MNAGKVALKKICILVDSSGIYRWYLWLADDLRDQGHEVMFCCRKNSGKDIVSSRVMLQLERMIYALPDKQSFDLLSSLDVGAQIFDKCTRQHTFDILVNFTDSDDKISGPQRVLNLLYDGTRNNQAIFAALFAKRNVAVCIKDSADKKKCWVIRPALEDRKVIGRALNNIFCRITELLLLVINGQAAQGVLALSSENSLIKEPCVRIPAPHNFLSYITRELVGKVSKKMILPGMTITEHWAIGWRILDDPALLGENEAFQATYNLIPDDGQRYFADPFIYQKDGLTYIFCEEYPYDTEKGIISVFRMEPDGTLSPSRVVLERPYHLSYPHLYESDGEIWMIPEAGAGGSVELYRAVSFPDQWQLEKVLLEGVAGYDASVTEHEGKFWMFLTTSNRLSTSWDNLEIYYADSLLGEWHPHTRNPVLIDGSVSRPGGEMTRHNGVLLRPVQDGSAIYGGSLNMCQVDVLDQNDFAQTVVGKFTVSMPEEAYGIHTINRAGNIEVVDILGKMAPDCLEATIHYHPVKQAEKAPEHPEYYMDLKKA